MGEQISALMDGELDEAEVRSCLDRMRMDKRLYDEWTVFHLIGDQLRGRSDAIFDCTRRVAERLAAESVPVAPAPRQYDFRKAPAWFALSAAVSVLGVTLVAWAALSLEREPESMALASLRDFSSVPSAAHRSSPDVGHDYLIAHQGVSPSGTLHGVSAYVRTVSDLGAEGGKKPR